MPEEMNLNLTCISCLKPGQIFIPQGNAVGVTSLLCLCIDCLPGIENKIIQTSVTDRETGESTQTSTPRLSDLSEQEEADELEEGKYYTGDGEEDRDFYPS